VRRFVVMITPLPVLGIKAWPGEPKSEPHRCQRALENVQGWWTFPLILQDLRSRTRLLTGGLKAQRPEKGTSGHMPERDSKLLHHERGPASPRALYAEPFLFRRKILEFSMRKS
jgi:hypothetical protein